MLVDYIASALGGGFVTAIGFWLGQDRRLTRIEDGLKALKTTVEEYKANPTCPLHSDIRDRLAILETKIGGKTQ